MGFWAYGKVMEALTDAKIIEAVDPEYTDIGQYHIQRYSDWFLGSSGKRTGRFFAGVDDFSIITPKFPTGDMSVEIPSISIHKQGDFEEIAYDKSFMKQDYFSANPYGAYGHADRDLIHYRNAAAPIALKVLSIGDSFTNVPCTFFPLVFSCCDEVDMRAYPKGEFEGYYEKFDPDLVIVMINARAVEGDALTYSFFP